MSHRKSPILYYLFTMNTLHRKQRYRFERVAKNPATCKNRKKKQGAKKVLTFGVTYVIVYITKTNQNKKITKERTTPYE